MFARKEVSPLVYIQVSADYRLDTVSDENLMIIREALGWEIDKGTFLPDLVLSQEKSYFVEMLDRGFRGECFSFNILFPCKFQKVKECEVLVTPVEIGIGGKTSKIGLAIRCKDELISDLAKLNSDGLLSVVFNSVSMGICITDRHGNFVEVNREYCRIYGYTREEMIGNSFTMVLDSAHHAELKQLHDNFFTSGQEPPSEFEVVTKDGRVLTVGIFTDKLITAEGEEFKVTSVTDISEIKELEGQLKNLTKNIPGIVLRYELRPDGRDRLLYVSEGIQKFCGLSPKEAIDDVSKIWERVHPEYFESLKKSIMDSARELTTWEAEWKYKHPDGTTHWHRASGNPKKLYDGTLIWDSIIMDITHEKEAESNLLRTEKRFEKLISEGVEMIAVLDSKGHYIYNSPSYTTLLGYSAEELNGLQAFSLIHPDDVPDHYASFEQVFKEKKVQSKPYRIRKKDGQYLWLKTTGNNLLHDPLINGIIVNSTDVSELIQVESNLKSSEQQYKYLFENNPGAMMIWDLQNGKILDVNDRTCSLYGYTREEFLNLTVYDIRPKGEVPKFQDQSKTENWVNYQGARLYYGISRHLDKAGNALDIEVNAQMITYKGRRVSLVLLHDVTQQRKEELRLKLLESAITNANDAVIITEAEPFAQPGPGIVYVNEAFTRMTGYTSEEVIGKNPRILQGPKTDRQELDRLKKALEEWRSCEVTLVNYKKNGEEFWTNFSVSPVADSKGWFTHWISIQRDVTAQKREEQKRELEAQIMQIFGEEQRFGFALERSLQKLIEFSELDGGEVWLVNADRTKVNLVSRYARTEQAKKFVELAKDIASFKLGEGLPGKIWAENQSLEINSSSDQRHFSRKNAVVESGLSRAFGMPLHYNQEVIGVMVFATHQFNGDVQSLMETFDPMKEMLGAEIFRKKAQDELSQVFDTAQDIICILGFDGKFKKINKGGLRLLGYTEEELLTNTIDHFLHPDDRESTQIKLNQMRAGSLQEQFVNRFITKEGQIVWLDWTSSVVSEEELIYSVAKNISEEKELQDLLESANKMARIGFWEWDAEKNTQYWSKITHEIFETDPSNTPTAEEGILMYDPDYVPLISSHFQACVTEGIPYDLELPITTRGGAKIWIRTRGQAEFRAGKCKRVYGSIQDITDLKIAQIELERAFEQKNAILESIGDAFFSVDKTGEITYWNQVASRLFGGTKEERVGSSVWNLIPITEENITLGKLREAITQNQVLRFEQFFIQLKKWLEITIYPSEIGLSVYLKDITLRKISEELVRQSNERFERVAQVTADAIWDWDVRKDKLYWGKGYEQLFGLDYNPDELNYLTWESHVHPEDLEKAQRIIEEAIEDIHSENLYSEYRFRRKDGSYAFVTDRALIIRDQHGSPTRIVGAVSDVTERKQYELSLRQLNEKLENRAHELAVSNAELEQFAYVASHDLQEPLRMVSSFLSQLEVKYGEKLDDRAKRYIYFAVDGVKRMRQIILDLLDFSRVGRINESLITFPLSGIIEEVKILQRTLLEDQKGKIITHDLPVLTSYRSPILQIFQNLISNGLKYSREGVAPVVEIFCVDQGDYWKFEIKDNGIGMEAESFDKIFVIFQRLHTQEKYSGSGIGLAIVKKIVNNLGGKIWVESSLGQGTSFFFTLPKNSKRNAEDFIG